MKTSYEIQRERIQEIENKASLFIDNCQLMHVSSINENGYPRVCVVSKLKNNSFKEIYFVTSKRSAYVGKATHFEKNNKSSICFSDNKNSVTLVGNIEFISDKEIQRDLWSESDRMFFKNGYEDSKFRLLKFTTLEATFWIDRKFRTVKY